jgi:hypothetical protein
VPKGNETASVNSRPKRRSRGVVLVVALVAVLSIFAAACGGGRSDSSDGSTNTTAKSTSSSFGTLDTPCGAGEAKGATQQGVTDTSITIGYGDDAGYAGAPGLNKEISEWFQHLSPWK